MEAGAYVRLSVYKGREEDEETIGVQLELIRQFMKTRKDLHLAEEYIERGYSGTDFERPEFNRMMEDVRTGRIQCIVVKDLSRFGRNFLETGYFLETLFPRLNVRFISVNEDLDSAREADRNTILVPVKNMINEMYAKDFSKKQTAIFEMRSKRGDVIIERSTYGYSLDKEHNRLVPNPETAPYVRIIFRWFLMGHGLAEIVRRLKALEVMTPFCYKATYEEGTKVPEKDCWRMDRVKTILENQVYAGDTVNGKRRKILYKNVPAHHTKREDWIIHKDTHKPLVLRADYEEVQRRFKERSEFKRQRYEALKETREQFRDSFPQKVRCMECGNTMLYTRYSHIRYGVGVQGACYVCEGSEVESGCKQRVYEDFLRIAVMDQIRTLVAAMCSRKAVLVKVRNGSCKQGAIALAQRRVQNLHYQLSEAEKTSATLYENYAAGVIDSGEYQYLKEHYILEKQRLQGEIKKAEEEERMLKKSLDRVMEIEEHLETFLGETGFNQKLVDELVERIFVSASGKLEIKLNLNYS